MGASITLLGAKVYIDFMYIEGFPILLMIDDVTRFSTAQFTEPLTTDSIWNTILTIWATVYAGLQSTQAFDCVSQFGDNFVEICVIYDVE